MALIEIICYLIQLLFIGTITYGIGHLVLSLFINTFERNFLFYSKLIVGVVLFVSFYALVKSSFHSYLLVVLPIISLMVYFFSNSFSLSEYLKRLKFLDLKNVFVLFSFFTFAFLLACLKVFSLKLALYELHPDFSYYSAISEILYEKGIESNYFDSALSGMQNYTFYHYFESWLNAFFLELSSNAGLHNLMLIVFPFFVGLSCLGTYFLMKIWHSKDGSSVLIFFLSFIILFIAPFIATIRWVFNLPSGEVPWNTSILSSQSIKSVVVLFGLNYCFLIYRYYKDYFVIAFLILAIIYPSLLVVIISSLICWFIFIYKSSYQEKWYKQSVISTIVLIVSFSIVLFINRNSGISTSSITASVWEYFSDAPSNWRILLKEPILRTIWMMITYAPFLLIGFLLYRRCLKSTLKRNYNLLLFLSIAYVLGVFGITLLDFLVNADQLFKNLFEPLLILLATSFLIKGIILSKEKLVRYLSLGILIASIFFSLPDILTNRPLLSSEYKKMAKILSPHLNSTAYIKSSNVNPEAYNIYFQIPYYNLRALTNNYFPKCLSVDKIPVKSLSDRYALNYIQNSTFFLDKIKNNKTYMEIIEEYRIQAVFIENNASEIDSFKSDPRFKCYYFEPYSLFIYKNHTK